ncbi:hypothetical protein AACT_0187 [Arcobacter acticola]|jgi:hypothetical protein|uniref:Lipoprotein n=1 Tax=Arcobacter acticola TaxID=1849015 RepID=A0A6M8EHS4_9BACT|nr:hypothetical protein [Arcobacter acticola]QKE27419.1 hypothetical protein AACT_0187 [Arcobacter acticola]
MTFKSILLIILLSLFITSCATKETIEEDVIQSEEKTFFSKKELGREAVNEVLISDINYILFLLKNEDLDTLNSRFINKKYGLYEVFKNSEDNRIYFKSKLQIDEISANVDSFDIKQEEAIFNCSPYDDTYYGWDKEGIFISDNTKPYLSDIMKKTNLLSANSFSVDELKLAEYIEKHSYEVVVPYNIVFYITKINKQWYITLIDKVKDDCSE